jgi:hypothetical protein
LRRVDCVMNQSAVMFWRFGEIENTPNIHGSFCHA